MAYTEEQLVKQRAANARYRATHLEQDRARCRASALAWNAANVGRKRAYEKARREANPAAHNAATLAWAKANPEKVRQHNARYQAANPERVKQNQLAAGRRWAQAHPEAVAAKASRRRAAKRHVGEKFTAAQRQRVKAQFRNKCFNCGATTGLHLDHHIPLSAGQPLAYGNAVLLCATCNPRKGNKLPETFYTHEQLRTLTALLAEQRSWGMK